MRADAVLFLQSLGERDEAEVQGFGVDLIDCRAAAALIDVKGGAPDLPSVVHRAAHHGAQEAVPGDTVAPHVQRVHHGVRWPQVAFVRAFAEGLRTHLARPAGAVRM